MTKSEDKPANPLLEMIATMADTTWRMFVPILGLLLVGIYFDKSYGLFPWMTLLGFALGAVLSAVLIRAQLRRGGK